MHFSKTYAQLLLTLPPELRENAIEYRQLKKLIKNVVDELGSLGLHPDVLHHVLQATTAEELQVLNLRQAAPSEDAHHTVLVPVVNGPETACSSAMADAQAVAQALKRRKRNSAVAQVLYEFDVTDAGVEPRLRLRLVDVADAGAPPHTGDAAALLPPGRVTIDDAPPAPPRYISTHPDLPPDTLRPPPAAHAQWSQELVVPLAADTAFYRLLAHALQSLSARLADVRADFLASLDALARTVSGAARPVSEGSRSGPRAFARGAKSDLYVWREIFGLYVEAEIFESTGERTRGERDVAEAERRLGLFVQRLGQSGLDERRLAREESKGAMQEFLHMNLFLLNLKKLQTANAEAIRKILKKHAKRTALPLPDLSLASSSTPLDLDAPPSALTSLPNSHPRPAPSATFTLALALSPSAAPSLAHILVQALGTTLLPVIPQPDDYACAICTALAFKPVRLRCAHLFCVRCLVKLQKRGRGRCPLCRAPTVLGADRSNVDGALLNFMADWFPREAREKLAANEREAAREEMVELGFDPDARTCCIM